MHISCQGPNDGVEVRSLQAFGDSGSTFDLVYRKCHQIDLKEQSAEAELGERGTEPA